MTCASSASSSQRLSVRHEAGPKREPAAQYEAIAELYDGYPGNYLEDILFYAEEAKQAGSPVLEIGVGTGRLAFCLAAIGLDVIGLDSSPSMLRLLERKREAVGGQPGRLQVVAADMRRFSLRQRFPLAICAFRTFLHLLTRADQRRALRAIRRHLAPGGRLIMSFFVPPKELLAAGGAPTVEMTRFPAPDGTGEVVAYDRTEVVAARRRLHSHITYEWRDDSDRPLRTLQHTMSMRYLFPEEVPLLLENCGYRALDCYGDFDRTPLTDRSREQIWIAEPIVTRKKRT